MSECMMRKHTEAMISREPDSSIKEIMNIKIAIPLTQILLCTEGSNEYNLN